jgi:hypothetical protein
LPQAENFEVGAVQQRLTAALTNSPSADGSDEETVADVKPTQGVSAGKAATSLLDPAILTQALIQLGIISPPVDTSPKAKPEVKLLEASSVCTTYVGIDNAASSSGILGKRQPHPASASQTRVGH